MYIIKCLNCYTNATTYYTVDGKIAMYKRYTSAQTLVDVMNQIEDRYNNKHHNSALYYYVEPLYVKSTWNYMEGGNTYVKR